MKRRRNLEKGDETSQAAGKRKKKRRERRSRGGQEGAGGAKWFKKERFSHRVNHPIAADRQRYVFALLRSRNVHWPYAKTRTDLTRKTFSLFPLSVFLSVRPESTRTCVPRVPIRYSIDKRTRRRKGKTFSNVISPLHCRRDVTKYIYDHELLTMRAKITPKRIKKKNPRTER